LEDELGYRFTNKELLVRALTHSSRAAERCGGLKDDNEQLEFLGDSVLGFVVSEALVDKYPGIKLIMAPTSVGIVAAAKAMKDEGLCDKVKVSGLGVPSEMVAYTMNGCAPQFALWSFVDLGYLAYYTAYALATKAIKAEEGASFTAGRMGNYTITKDPTRANGLRVLMDGLKANSDLVLQIERSGQLQFVTCRIY